MEPNSSLSSRVLGAPLEVVLERSAPGALADGAIDETLALLSGAFDVGYATRAGNTFHWVLQRSQNDLRRVDVLILEREGDVMVTARQKFSELAGMAVLSFFMASVMLVIACASLLQGLPSAISVVVVVVGPLVALGVARFLYSRSVARHTRKLTYIAECIVRAIRQRAGHETGGARRVLPRRAVES